MPDTEKSLALDIERIKQIPIVPKMLDVICKTTGMGFAAVARVTKDRWIACSVRDEILFGLQPGGELPVATTLCDQIRDTHVEVVVDDFEQDQHYSAHHTPEIYGLRSYISVPIFLKNGDFFGTLCAIDPRPAVVNNSKTIDMFNMFAELISFHLESLQLLEKSKLVVDELSEQLIDSIEENRQYQYISNHNLQEPLRKIRIFSSMLIDEMENKDSKAHELALKLNKNAHRFSLMIHDLSDYSGLNKKTTFEKIDLNNSVSNVITFLETEIQNSNAVIKIANLPEIYGIPLQIEQLFYHLLLNALKFSKKDSNPIINIIAVPRDIERNSQADNDVAVIEYTEIQVIDNGIGIDKAQLDKIFNIFSRLSIDNINKGEGIGLSYCKKIIRNHKGTISVKSEMQIGSVFSITLPFSS